MSHLTTVMHFRDGERAARMGHPASSCPFPHASPAAFWWLRGHAFRA